MPTILKLIAESKTSIRDNVRESIRFVTKVIDSTQAISSKYVKPAAWLAAADAIEKRLRTHHGYIKFLLSDKEAGKYYQKTFGEFANFCTQKISK